MYSRWYSIGTVFKNNTQITTFEEIRYFTALTSFSEQAFAYSSIQHLTAPEGVKRLNNQVFRGASSFTWLDLPSTTTYIGDWCFGQSGLRKLTVRALVPPTLVSGTFASVSLTNIYVPASVVDTYKAASGWSSKASIISAIPE